MTVLPMILHLASEYLDPLRPPPTTEAVLRLVDRMIDHPQVVISLKRVSDPRKAFWRDLGMVDGRRLIVYHHFAPPLGVGMLASQLFVARRISRFLAAEGLRPDIVHAHRFTFEGIAAWRLAKRLKAALFYSVRGEVESKVFRAKPTYRPMFRRMARDAARIYYVSAWFKPAFEHHTGVDAVKSRLLPNFVRNARSDIPPVAPSRCLVIPMSLRAIDKKGLPELLKAFADAGPELDGVSLEIIGEGPRDAHERISALVASNGLKGRVILKGSMDNAALLDRLTTSLGLAMASHNETFGMVYPEALFAGIPILYSAGTGIDGYLEGLPVGVAVTPGDHASIRDGLIRLVRDNRQLRAAIKEHAEALFSRFSPDAVEARYRADIADAVRSDTGVG